MTDIELLPSTEAALPALVVAAGERASTAAMRADMPRRARDSSTIADATR
jgi:hypothetical protein